METIVLVVHVLAALAIIGLILLQQGKGASMGASFGSGASQTVFGSSGGGHFLAKVTGVAALVFFITSFSLAVIAKRGATPEQEIDLPGFDNNAVPAVEEQIEAAPQSDVPLIEESTQPSTVPSIEEQEEPEPAANTDSQADEPVEQEQN